MDKLTSENLNDIRNYYNRERGDREIYLWDYYTGKDVPIFKRVPVSYAKRNSHTNIHEDFFKDIIDLKTGYMGQKILVTHKTDKIVKALEEFHTKNKMTILNSDLVRKASITGMASRLIYVKDGEVRVKNIGQDVGTVVYEYDDNPLDCNRAFFYYSDMDLYGKITRHCDVYDKLRVYHYIAKEKDKNRGDRYKGIDNTRWNDVSWKYESKEVHFFNEVPIIPFINNDTWTGDCDKVIADRQRYLADGTITSNTDNYRDGLMDAYDAVLSDTISEIKAMRLAYLKIWGTIYTGKDKNGNPIDINDWLRATSSMNFPVDDIGKPVGDAQWLEKNINDVVIENQLNRLRASIYEKSGSIDVRGIADNNNQRILSIKTQLMRLENNCANTESYFRAGLEKQYRLWSYIKKEYYNLVQKDDIEISFKRVFPRDLESESTIMASMSNILELEDVLDLLGYENAKELAERANKDEKMWNEMNQPNQAEPEEEQPNEEQEIEELNQKGEPNVKNN